MTLPHSNHPPMSIGEIKPTDLTPLTQGPANAEALARPETVSALWLIVFSLVSHAVTFRSP